MHSIYKCKKIHELKMIRPMFPISELLLSILIIIFCFVIYFKTRELFNLTKHRGIYYFRIAFLFLGISYFIRLGFRLFNVFSITSLPSEFMFPIFLVTTGYFSTFAIISLFLSVSWKRFRWSSAKYPIHAMAMLTAVLAFLSKEPLVLIIAQASLLLLTAVFAYLNHKHSKKGSQLFAYYVLLFIFWIVSLAPFSPRHILSHESFFILHLIPIAVFSIIIYKIYKWLR
jgi:hypothetical protein